MSDAAIIRQLNDRLRTRWCGGRVLLTAGVHALPAQQHLAVIRAISTFDAFNRDKIRTHVRSSDMSVPVWLAPTPI
jgi:hypothetical protein